MTKTTRGDERGKVKLRFVEFELEGLSSTIEESIKSIVASMGRASSGALPARSHGNGSLQAPKLVDAKGNDGLGPVDPETVNDDLGQDEEREDQSSAGVARASRRYTQPKFLEDFDLDGGEKPFKAFAAEIAPETDNHKYLVIAAWSKQYRGLEAITMDHIYTCYQKMGWKSQKDVGQPFRKMKRSSLFQNPSRGQWKMTHIGLDRVEHGPTDSD